MTNTNFMTVLNAVHNQKQEKKLIITAVGGILIIGVIAYTYKIRLEKKSADYEALIGMYNQLNAEVSRTKVENATCQQKVKRLELENSVLASQRSAS